MDVRWGHFGCSKPKTIIYHCIVTVHTKILKYQLRKSVNNIRIYLQNDVF